MKVLETRLSGCFLLEPAVFEDDRGYFMETYNQERFEKASGIQINFVQDNQSYSKKGVVRALHYQTGDFAQAKLVRVLRGEVMDVAVDLRPDSDTFGQHISVLLSASNKKQLFIPRGFAHGFVALSDHVDFFYKCDNFYNKEAEGGIIYNDPSLNIDWKLPSEQLLVSEKDLLLPKLERARL
ncbi:dTDP-4-dehydrorhamnose 3,5-epimerase [Robiginitalea sp. M366]|uniref:dTDP-4-dehydrorhamnose 3,5-epimerase n=1 Tax=Robiginitalea aestuariiviva TaxID=3036903 RepID=UPI00240E5BC1|nr:dTDP-4-dehydrorhamnose 3,5-epimerase [Robiginitalea aestuariiviva]MDG1571483.1 dTDP-4-dehydrorhamnose 3,5-epimerase [Robiginitalea aestuariiviva]